MAILTIKSENQDLSWVLVKNPSTGTISRRVRGGKGYGWFEDKNTYNVMFIDGANRATFTRDNSDVLETSRYNHPLIYSSLINTLLGSAITDDNEKDVPAKASVTMLLVGGVPKKTYRECPQAVELQDHI